MNFSRITSETALGKILRLPLRLLPRGTTVPILQGPLKGKKWIVGSSDHGCWLGSYEHAKQKLFIKHVPVGGTVFDVGAHVGFYTLLASQLVGESGHVAAFEPFPENAAFLRRHIDLNKFGNVSMFEAAVSDHDGTITFLEGPTRFTGKVDPSGGRSTRSVTLDTLVAQGEVPVPNLIKMDIEGAELGALKGAATILAQHRPTIFLATHGKDIHSQCCQFLGSLGYRLESLDGSPLEQVDEIIAR
ncbi:methyltransferase, FkbM family [Singulisphaera sp. GP187]|uniref:FkbM family methyltransferase n=1 Tax=Singulisphaera sp. GP187 TaxID=1882752 RepID=UPI00092C97FC|nr:FkbM family methyltransferase [Singulisphaera sp. GP187]SIO55242.1 methyltransferase, FkbM family [Singulisphaera sp. GP187]